MCGNWNTFQIQVLLDIYVIIALHFVKYGNIYVLLAHIFRHSMVADKCIIAHISTSMFCHVYVAKLHTLSSHSMAAININR